MKLSNYSEVSLISSGEMEWDLLIPIPHRKKSVSDLSLDVDYFVVVGGTLLFWLTRYYYTLFCFEISDF